MYKQRYCIGRASISHEIILEKSLTLSSPFKKIMMLSNSFYLSSSLILLLVVCRVIVRGMRLFLYTRSPNYSFII